MAKRRPKGCPPCPCAKRKPDEYMPKFPAWPTFKETLKGKRRSKNSEEE